MVLNVHRNHNAYEGWGEVGGYGGEGRGRLSTYRHTVTTGMTSALRWAATRAILMFRNCEGQSHKTASTDHNFWSERRAEADSNRGPSAYQPNALLLGQTGSHCPAEQSRGHLQPVASQPVCSSDWLQWIVHSCMSASLEELSTQISGHILHHIFNYGVNTTQYDFIVSV